MEIQPFEVHVSEPVLEDLHDRLAHTRWPDEVTGSGWDYGSNLAYTKELVDYWHTRFDWRAQEKAINAFNHFQANVDGLWVHFVHERGKGPHPIPLLLTHGWPGPFTEMLKILPLLTDPASHGGDPADSFDVVVPSLPGYGFFGKPTQGGMSVLKVADLWGRLMAGLDYQRFGAHGGDWGAAITLRLGSAFPKMVIGSHVTLVTLATLRPYLGPGSRELTEAEKGLLEERANWFETEGGYSHIQRTRPQTLSYGLNDSPAGLAAWLVEKFRSWTDCGGDVERKFTKDELLTYITLYWVTETIGSSTRLYYESFRDPWVFQPDEKVTVPCGVALFPKEIAHPPREWAERSLNIQRWTKMPRGGHFAALEEPELLAEDIRAFFRPLR